MPSSKIEIPISGLTNTISSYPLCPSVRLGICVLGFFGITVCATLYSSLHFAWVCMVNATAVDGQLSNEYDGSLHWGKQEQRFMFAAYSFGGIFLTLPAGWLTDKFGAKYVLAFAICLSAVSTLLIPISAVNEHGKIVVVFLRVIDGIGGSVMWPALYSVCSHWAAKNELGFMLALILSGLQTGQFLNMVLSGVFCRRITWQFIFYFWGTIGVFFALFWLLVYQSDPEDSSKISKKEKDYILANRAWEPGVKKPGPPWKSILSSLPVWSCMVSNFCGLYIIFMVNQYTPTFMKEALHMKVEKNGFVSSLPFILQILGRWISGPLSDRSFPFMTSRTTVLKIFNTGALLGAACCTLGLTFVSQGTPESVSVVLLCATLFFMAFSTGGYYKCPLYIAPQYSSTIGALSTISGFLATILLPYIVAAMTPNGSGKEWRSVFYTAVGLGVFGSIFFLAFGQGELQPWATGTGTGTTDTSVVHPLPTITGNTQTEPAQMAETMEMHRKDMSSAIT